MRITGGRYRGRTILCPPGVIRPAMDRMRESLFSILGSLDGHSFLDLFSGSGCVGIEAASRGAEPVHLIEMDKLKKDVILKNISFVESPIRLFMADALRFIRASKNTYSIIYADPPFPRNGKVRLAQAVADSSVLEDGGLFIIHYPAEENAQWPQSIGNLVFTDERVYGRSHLRFYRKDASRQEAMQETSQEAITEKISHE
ncbi:16S rRNA (guanine(966)-N(2))-methyltransferase RsmD [Parasphaerochaeta coccoides]|uniref:Methyltransferase n=1 Tax=Parasphaerochaeta coccoides (strain ATCC BAA-1237 / DSM 17374 / SPN1) TaxID=760011 RepID=F4GLV5_PARC1|nr:16S rRNA (guanine(966)-N(2))-methyltransferase RsmD [Parasphaerochaeta coccoides]AEC02996.1 methyltransferase [Parasphaerochaeta coccoides DSM 17374]